MPLIASELFNRNLSIVYPTLFFNFVIAPTYTSQRKPVFWHILQRRYKGKKINFKIATIASAILKEIKKMKMNRRIKMKSKNKTKTKNKRIVKHEKRSLDMLIWACNLIENEKTRSFVFFEDNTILIKNNISLKIHALSAG